MAERGIVIDASVMLALAEVTGSELWTADRRFAASLRKKAARIRLV